MTAFHGNVCLVDRKQNSVLVDTGNDDIFEQCVRSSQVPARAIHQDQHQIDEAEVHFGLLGQQSHDRVGMFQIGIDTVPQARRIPEAQAIVQPMAPYFHGFRITE